MYRQLEGQSFNNFITELKKLSTECEFENLRDFLESSEMSSVELRFLLASELNFYSYTMLHYVSLTNIKQGVNQETRVQLQVINNLIKSKFI